VTTIRLEQRLSEPAHLVGDVVLGVPEDQWFDRKSARVKPPALADSLIGFGNAEGGTIVVGLSDGTIEGTDHDPARRNALLQAAVDYTVPPVRVRHRLVPCINSAGAEDHLLVLDIEASESDVHANTKDVAFLRIGDENRKLTFAQRQELQFDKGQGVYEIRGSGLDMGALDEVLVEGYCAALETSDVEQLLHARGLAKGPELTVAGGLLFAATPQATFPEAYVRVLRYGGRERGTGSRQQLVEDIRLEGPLPRQVLDARDAVERLQPRRRALTAEGIFADVALVPRDAWLEAIVNAVIHRSYSLAGDHIRVEIFDDRIEVSSPGRFPGIVAMSDPETAPRYARNPRMARVMADLNYGQELGEGIKRMYEEMRLAGLQAPMYRQSAASVRVELSGEPTDRRLDSLLPEETRLVVTALRAKSRLSTGELAEIMGVQRPAAIRRLREMRVAGVIEWIGKSPRDPRAYWTLPNSQ